MKLIPTSSTSKITRFLQADERSHRQRSISPIHKDEIYVESLTGLAFYGKVHSTHMPTCGFYLEKMLKVVMQRISILRFASIRFDYTYRVKVMAMVILGYYIVIPVVRLSMWQIFCIYLICS